MQLKDLLDLAYQTEGLITLLANSPDNDPERAKYIGQLIVDHADRLAAASREHFNIPHEAPEAPAVPEVPTVPEPVEEAPQDEIVINDIIEADTQDSPEDTQDTQDSPEDTQDTEDTKDAENAEEIADNLLFEEEADADIDLTPAVEDDFIMDIIDETAPAEPQTPIEEVTPIEADMQPMSPKQPIEETLSIEDEPIEKEFLIEDMQPMSPKQPIEETLPIEDEPIEEEEEIIVEDDMQPTSPKQPIPTHSSTDDAPVSDLNSAISRFRGARTFTQTFPLNDRYCFTRELFGNSRVEFKSAIDLIDAMHTPDEVDEYFINDLGWDSENEIVQQFITLARNYIAEK